MHVRIRAAEAPDTAAIAAIYNQGIAERQATFETEARTADDVAGWLTSSNGAPVLGAIKAEAVVGWARLSPYSSRSCYAGVGEASLYVDRDARGAGLGRGLFEALAAEAERRGYWKIVGGWVWPRSERIAAGRNGDDCAMEPGRSQVRILRAGRERLPELEPLWKALHRHHARITPRLATLPGRDPDDSWRRRLAKYERWLEDSGTFFLLAEDDGTAVGYAFVTTGPGLTSWEGGEELAELQTLSVLPDHQGRGVGAALLDAVRGELAASGVTDLIVTTTLMNEDSHRFYERHGLAPIYKVFLGRTEECR